MKPNILPLGKLLLLAAAALSLAVFARADVTPDDPPAETPVPVNQGLLGQKYATLTYGYHDLDNSPVHADSFEFAFNQPLSAGLDGVLTYDWTQTGRFAGNRLNTQSVTAGLRAFSNAFAWGKPYVGADAGYAWQRGFGGHDNSLLWAVAAGVELQVAQAITVTPSLQYADAPDLAGRGAWTYGVRANYWVDSQWAVTAGLARDDDRNLLFTVGTNFRF